MKISNWGKFPSINAIVKNFSLSNELKNELPGYKPVIARGLGRCYGDSSLSKYILSTLKFNRITSLNAVDGIIVCQAGVSLKEMIEIIVPKGWFLPVTPGTKFVTIGGAVASDVHGKNHHQVGSFSEFIIYLDVLLSDGSVIRCSREKNIEIFHGVCGGMGLTGIILAVSLKLKKINTSFIKQKLIKTKHLTETMDLFNQHEQRTYSVAWIDCLSSGSSLGRGVLMLGEHARNEEIKADKFGKTPPGLNQKNSFRIPFNLPRFFLNNYSARLFNFMYYHKTNEEDSMIDLDTFFYPLDRIHDWNKIYGSGGFVQYQFVLPKEISEKGLLEILKKINDRRSGCFLAVLKLMGQENRNMISFPMEGYTLALDFPITPDLFNFLNELDKIVLNYGGRLYLAKDARMSREMFLKSYLRANEFINIKSRLDKENRFESLQSKRLGLSS